MTRFLVPLGVFAGLLVLFLVGLRLNPREIPSPLIDKPAPAFSLPRLNNPGQDFSPADMQGRVWLLNVWASWCVACREEHPLLVEASRTGALTIVGLNYKDEPADAERWLQTFGNPYALSAIDRDGRIGIDYGVYGVPETFLIDKTGVIRYKRIGPVSANDLESKILPLVQEYERQ